MLEFENIQIDLAEGIDQSTDAKQVAPNKLLTLRNRVFTKLKQLKKVFGFTKESIHDDGSLKVSTASYQNELVIEEAGAVRSLIPDITEEVARGTIPRLRVKSHSSVRNDYSQSNVDTAAATDLGLLYLAWKDSRGTINFQIESLTDGSIYQEDTVLLDGSSNPVAGYRLRMSHLSTQKVGLFILNGNTLSVSVNTSDDALEPPVTVVSDVLHYYDVLRVNAITVLAYFSSTSNVIKVCLLGTDGLVTSTISVTPTGSSFGSLSVYMDSGTSNIFVGYTNEVAGGTLRMFVRNSILGSVLADTAVDAGSGLAVVLTGSGTGVSNEVRWIYSPIEASRPNLSVIHSVSITSTGTTVTTTNIEKTSVAVASRAFKAFNGRWYIVGVHESVLQATYFLLDCETGQVQARPLYGEAGTTLGDDFVRIVPSVVTSGSDIYSFAGLRKTAVTNVLSAGFSFENRTTITSFGVETIQFDFADTLPIPCVEAQENLVMASSVTTLFDGVHVTECGFHLYPTIESVDSTWTGSAAQLEIQVQGDASHKEQFKIQMCPAEYIEVADYFIFSNGSSVNNYYVWFKKNGIGTDPAVASRTGILVDLEVGDSAAEVARKVYTKLTNPTYAPVNITITLNEAEKEVSFANTVNGFATDPSIAAFAIGRMAIGTYQYRVVYEWSDAKGNIFRSAPSASYESTSASGSKGTLLEIPALTLTEKENVSAAIYRTENNGTVYYKVSSVRDPHIVSTPGSATTLFFLDVMDDSEITTREILYTEGGVVENICPPSADVILKAKNRIFLYSRQQGAVWYTKPLFQKDGLNFSDVFTLTIDRVNEFVEAMGELDDKVVFFKKDKPYFIVGDGPNAAGGGQGFSEPEPIATASGASDRGSVVILPSGLMRKSDKGYHLLGRDLQDYYIGKAVEDFNEDTCLSAEKLEDLSQVRFLIDTGEILIYDFEQNQWSVRDFLVARDACVHDGDYWVTTEDDVWRETNTIFQDAPNDVTVTDIETSFETSWLKVSTLAGYQRVQRATLVGEYRSPHVITVQVGYDYETAYTDTYTFTPTGSAGDPLQFEMHLSRQKCEALRFKVTDAGVVSGELEEGNTLTAFVLKVGRKRGTNKLPASKRI